MVAVVESATFGRWIRGLADRAAVARINARLRNVSLGNMGDTRMIGGGLFEMRVHHGRATGSTVCVTGTRSWCSAAATRAARRETLSVRGGWRRTGGGDDRDIEEVGRS